MPDTNHLSSLPALVSAAAGRLSQARNVAELLDVREDASVVYDAAKTAARLARTKINVDEITRAAHRAQADALEIESAALVRLADEYDAAQSRGDVAGQGGNGGKSKVSAGDLAPPTLADVGLTKQDIYRARQLRDAEVREPGVIAKALAARFANGENPNRTFLRNVVANRGASGAAVGNERNANAANPEDENLYQTPWVAVDVLLSHLKVGTTVWEPAMGPGAIARRLTDKSVDVRGSDLIDYELDSATGEFNPVWEQLKPVVADFLSLEKHPFKAGTKFNALITNPPYNKADEFVAQALTMARKYKIPVVAMLLRVNFMAGCGAGRCASLDGWIPSRQIIFSRRLPMMHREDFEGQKASSRLDTCWLIWELDKQDVATTATERVDWKHDLKLSDSQWKAVMG